MRFNHIAAAAALAAEGASAQCNADNCLRALRATRLPERLAEAQAFCSSFTTTSVAAIAIPTFAADACKDNQNGPLYARLSSACSCLPVGSSTTSGTTTTSAGTSSSTGTTSTTGTTSGPTTAPTAACAKVSSLWAAQSSSKVAQPTVAAQLAYDCLNSVPLHKEDATKLLDAMEPYIEWQSDPEYKAEPPAGYSWPGADVVGNYQKIRAKLAAGGYTMEYQWHEEMYEQVFGKGHDGHWVFYSDLLSRAFDFNRQRNLVSISEDGSSLPVIKIYEDIVANPSTASVVTQINGVEASKYVFDNIARASWNQDADAAYNSVFYQKAFEASGNGKGFFGSGGRIRYLFQGANTTFTFANGTSATFENYARIKASFAGVTDGETMYKKFCTPVVTALSIEAEEGLAEGAIVGYPPSIVPMSDDVVGCFFLDGEEFKDVVVISLLEFSSNSPSEFQAVVQKCIAKAVDAGKTKLVVDFQANGGGYILQGYDFYRQLFPQVDQDGFSRWKENPGFMAISEIFSAVSENFDPYTSSDADRIEAQQSWFNWRYDLNITNGNFTSFADKFAPQFPPPPGESTPYTDLMRWNFNDPLTTTNNTFGIGFEMTGYGTLANVTQPFAAENIVMLLDGWCASTCTLAYEFLRIHGGVKSVAFGGRPQPGKIDGVGGVKGSQTLQYSAVKYYVDMAKKWATTDAQKAALNRYSTLPMQRSTAGALNTRDQILRDHVQDGIPAQFVHEEADCRLFWTEPMLSDVTAVWKAAAGAAFNGKKCVAGGISSARKRDVEVEAAELARRYQPPQIKTGGYEMIKRGENSGKSQAWWDKNFQKAVM